MRPDTPHPYPRLFTRANARLQRSLSATARFDLMVLTMVVLVKADEGSVWEDVCYLLGYGLITACPN
jgi:hypothetical protein